MNSENSKSIVSFLSCPQGHTANPGSLLRVGSQDNCREDTKVDFTINEPEINYIRKSLYKIDAFFTKCFSAKQTKKKVFKQQVLCACILHCGLYLFLIKKKNVDAE